jgi:hypothetical protein
LVRAGGEVVLEVLVVLEELLVVVELHVGEDNDEDNDDVVVAKVDEGPQLFVVVEELQSDHGSEPAELEGEDGPEDEEELDEAQSDHGSEPAGLGWFHGS